MTNDINQKVQELLPIARAGRAVGRGSILGFVAFAASSPFLGLGRGAFVGAVTSVAVTWTAYKLMLTNRSFRREIDQDLAMRLVKQTRWLAANDTVIRYSQMTMRRLDELEFVTLQNRSKLLPTIFSVYADFLEGVHEGRSLQIVYPDGKINKIDRDFLTNHELDASATISKTYAGKKLKRAFDSLANVAGTSPSEAVREAVKLYFVISHGILSGGSAQEVSADGEIQPLSFRELEKVGKLAGMLSKNDPALG